MSMQIKEMEETLGCVLLERGARQVGLTKFGEEVAQRVALAFDRLLAVGEVAQDRRDPDFDGHGHIVATRTTDGEFRSDDRDRLLCDLALDDAEAPQLDDVRVTRRHQHVVGAGLEAHHIDVPEVERLVAPRVQVVVKDHALNGAVAQRDPDAVGPPGGSE